MGWITGRSARRRGLALVEMALVLPLLVLLTFAIIEYGWLFVKYEQLTGITHRAARMASLADTTKAQVEGSIDDLLAKAGLKAAAQKSVPNLEALNPGQEFTITVSVAYGTGFTQGGPSIGLTGFVGLPVPAKLTASVVMAREGQG